MMNRPNFLEHQIKPLMRLGLSDRASSSGVATRPESTLFAQVGCGMRNALFEVRLVLIFILAVASLHAAPSVVVLDSGEQLIGEVLPNSTGETLVLKSAVLGELKLPRNRVLSIQPEASKTSSKPTPVVEVSPLVVPLIDEEAVAEERRILDAFKDFRAPESWSGNMRFGVNLSQGDRKWAETYANAKLEINPEKSANFYRFTGSYTYRQTERADGSEYKSTDKYDSEFIYRRTFLDDWFLQNALGYRSDKIKGIGREAQDTLGIGYRYKPSESFDLLFGGGGGVGEFDVDFEDTRSGLNPLLNVFQEATWRPLKRTSLVQKFNYYWNPKKTDQFNYVFTAAIRIRFTDLLGFEFSYSKSFDNDVGDGNARDDTQWRNAIVVYF